MTDFNDIPKQWALCPGNGCPRAAECLRHLAYSQAPADVGQWLCVVHTASGDDDCPYFQKAEKKLMAYGMSRVFSSIHNRHVRRGLRLKISAYLGSNGTFYRYKAGRKGLTPEQQQWITDLVRSSGGAGGELFDSFVEAYDFQTSPSPGQATL